MIWTRSDSATALIDSVLKAMAEASSPIFPQDSIPILEGETTYVRGAEKRWTTYADDGRHAWIVRAGIAL